MFSRRTDWSRLPNFSAGFERQGALDLTTSNPTEVALPYDEARISAALSHPNVLRYAPSPLGTVEAREAIADYYARRKISVDPDDIMVVASTSEAYTFLFRLLTDPGDTVLNPLPSYPLFNYLADLGDVHLSSYRLQATPNRWALDRPSLDVARDARTRAIIVVSPNNPTGSYFDEEEWSIVEQMACAHGWAILSDEVFLDYADGPIQQVSAIGSRRCLTFSLSGLSKVAGLPQMKVGWVVLSGPNELKKEARARLELIGDTHLTVSAPVMLALPELLRGAEVFQAALRKRLAENRRHLIELLEPAGLKPTAAGWYASVHLPEALGNDEVWTERLYREAQVLVHPGYFYDIEAPACVVLSTIVQPEIFDQGIRRILEVVARARSGA